MSQLVEQGVGGMLDRITRSHWGWRVRQMFFLAGDAVLLLASLVIAALLRFDGRIPPELWQHLPLVALISLAVKIPVFASQRLYALSWSQVSLDDMIAVVRGVTLGTALFWAVVFALKGTTLLAGFPRSILLIDYVVTLHAVGGFRMALRAYKHLARRPSPGGRAALIVGAGAAGEQLARSLASTPASGYTPVGFIDDDPGKTGSVIHGLRVLGDRQRMPEIIRRHSVEAVLIAVPSAPSRAIRQFVSLSREAGVREIRIIPGLDSLLNGRLSFTDLRDLQLSDLLGREVVRIDTADVEGSLRDRVVMVTGAGGSIGSELCRQALRFLPRELVLVDYDESGLFWIEQELQRMGHRPRACVGDVRDAERMRGLLLSVRPHVVFHAAAYKHVGLMERHSDDAVRTNVLGTQVVAEASAEAGAEKFILISTDKAVNPTSVMGASKRVAEQICLALNAGSGTRFIAVRFGNVLGSRGSVVPIFQEQIRRGEPLTIRGENMQRYFMEISEAVLLVLQAGAMGRGGEIFVLDMGAPVRIVDFARELIRLSGLEPGKDVPIVFTEPEPGEKESEDLLTAEEGTLATRHDRIFVSRATMLHSPQALPELLTRLEATATRRDLAGMVRILQELVPTYHPSDLLQRSISAIRET